MQDIEAQEMFWFAVRVKRKQAGGIRSVTVGGEFEAYRDRAGRMRKRRIDGTGKRVFLPEHILRRAGFEVFLPVKKVLRQKNRFTHEKHLASQPLLVDWLFVGWPADEMRWYDLMALDVVVGVMGTGGRPALIPQSRVMQLMRQWGGGLLSPVCHQYVKQRREFAAGDIARVIDGPLEGVQVRIIDVGGPTVKAMVDILGGEVIAEIRSDVLDAVRPDGVK